MAVYFVLASSLNAVKIGYAENVDKRIYSIQTNFPEKLTKILELEGDRLLEKNLHKQFKKFRRSGEWFEFGEEIKDFIANPGKYGVKNPIRNLEYSKNVKQYWAIGLMEEKPGFKSELRMFMKAMKSSIYQYKKYDLSTLSLILSPYISNIEASYINVALHVIKHPKCPVEHWEFFSPRWMLEHRIPNNAQAILRILPDYFLANCLFGALKAKKFNFMGEECDCTDLSGEDNRRNNVKIDYPWLRGKIWDAVDCRREEIFGRYFYQGSQQLDKMGRD